MEFLLALFFLGVIVTIIGGSICGIVAVRRMQNLQVDLELLQNKVRRLEDRFFDDAITEKVVKEKLAPKAPPVPSSVKAPLKPSVATLLVEKKESSGIASSPLQEKKESVSLPEKEKIKEAALPPAVPVPAHVSSVKKPRVQESTSALSLEMQLGTRWIIWVGAVIFLGGVALALKYTYDNNLIGPSGRIMIGALTGVIVLFVGEYFERRKLVIPFQAFTGGGLAIFYLCIFFAFQVYHLTGAGIAMSLATVVTLFAISLSVIHNAMPIALLAVAGGYMSPVFLSTGENAPWQLFTYIAILNLVALGAGYFRRWRVLDLFCFAGTALLYLGWQQKFYSYPDQVAPALTFVTLFYVMFMIAPVLYSLVRGIPEGLQSLTLIIGNSLFWLYCYYVVLYKGHQFELGFIALMQSLFVLLLYTLWVRRVKEATPTAQSLLIISLSLLTLVIPLWLRFYAIPLSWAVEGVVFLWLSFRFRNIITRYAGVAVLILSVAGLCYYLPLHTSAFTFLLNSSFGAWFFVILCVIYASVMVYRKRMEGEDIENLVYLSELLALGALIMTCFLLTTETFLYWKLRGGEGWMLNATTSLVVLWTGIPAVLSGVSLVSKRERIALVAMAAQACSLVIFLFCFKGIEHVHGWFLLNLFFIPRAMFVIVLWWEIVLLQRILTGEFKQGAKVIECCAYGAFLILSFFELDHWTHVPEVISSDVVVRTMSDIWVFLACLLMCLGFRLRNELTRFASIAFLVVAVGGLIYSLPLHKEAFIPVFNLAFVHWAFAACSVFYVAYQIYDHRIEDEVTLVPAAGIFALIGVVMACFLLTVETFQFWEIRAGDGWFVNASAAVTLLWIVIPAAMVYLVMIDKQPAYAWLAQGGYAFTLLVFIFGIGGLDDESQWLGLNLFALPKILLIVALWWGISVLAKAMPRDTRIGKPSLELAGHIMLAMLSFMELIRWGRETEVITTDMAVGIVSAAWALQACILIWYGLVTRNQLRRYVGFVLFAMAAGKTVFIDVFELDAVYRIVSWLGVGMLLVVAALLYQRYSVILLSEEKKSQE